MSRPKPATTVRSNMGQYCVTPLWVAESVSGRALQLFVILAAKYADRANEEAMVSRRGLAKSLGCSLDTVDRGLDELVAIGALEIENQRDPDGNKIENLYRLLYSRPEAYDRKNAATPSRKFAATPSRIPSRKFAASTDQEDQERDDAQLSSPESAKTQERTADEKSLPVQRTASSVSVQPVEKFFSPGPEFDLPAFGSDQVCEDCGQEFDADEGETICPNCIEAFVSAVEARRLGGGVTAWAL